MVLFRSENSIYLSFYLSIRRRKKKKLIMTIPLWLWVDLLLLLLMMMMTPRMMTLDVAYSVTLKVVYDVVVEAFTKKLRVTQWLLWRLKADGADPRKEDEKEDQSLASCCWSLLPEDLEFEILSRLPVKSLMQLKSVCKRWCSLPTNPSFIAAHLKKNDDSPNRLVTWNGNDSGLTVGHDGFHTFLYELYGDLQPVNLTFGFCSKPDLVLGPCDGIFCLYWSMPCVAAPMEGGELNRIIALWNPATRAFRILPTSIFDSPPYEEPHSCMVGFGLDLKTKSYKVVKIAGYELASYGYVNCVEVFNLRSGSWRVLHADGFFPELYVHDIPQNSTYNKSNGVFHWYAYYNYNCHDSDYSHLEGLVLSFDMSKELFHMTVLPEKFNAFTVADYPLKCKECYLGLMRDSLAVIFSFAEEGHTSVEVWVMEMDFEVPSSKWSHVLTVEQPMPGAWASVGFWNMNELLIRKRPEDIPQLRSGELVTFLYNIVSKEARDVKISGEGNFMYKESLVSVNG